jgi:hypothetical protein
MSDTGEILTSKPTESGAYWISLDPDMRWAGCAAVFPVWLTEDGVLLSDSTSHTVNAAYRERFTDEARIRVARYLPRDRQPADLFDKDRR